MENQDLQEPLVFCDWHHGALYYSMHLLFEKRLGGTLIRPTGFDWYRKGFWGHQGFPRSLRLLTVVKQYLKLPPEEFLKDGIYYVPAQEGAISYTHKAITLDKFKELDFKFVIVSLANHEATYQRLIKDHNPGAVLIRQMGTAFERCNFNIVRNILNSTTIPVPPKANSLHYHPEFSLEDYRYVPPETHKTIRNIMHLLPRNRDAPLWYEYRKALPDYVWKMHGFQGEDGVLLEQQKPGAFRDASFIWHLKRRGDGYGFVIHNAYACGRPCIIRGSSYRKLTASPLLQDSVTCIDLELGSKDENVKKIRHFSEPENHLQMCENAHKRFKEVVDFDKEFIQIKEFLRKAIANV